MLLDLVEVAVVAETVLVADGDSIEGDVEEVVVVHRVLVKADVVLVVDEIFLRDGVVEAAVSTEASFDADGN